MVTKVEAEELLRDALRRFNEVDHDMPSDVNERSITHRVAVYIEEILRSKNIGYSVDCEYNRQGGDTKRIFACVDGISEEFVNLSARELIEDDKGRTVFPDIVVHERGRDGRNVLVIEAKLRLRATPKDIERDERKLHAYVACFRYEHAYLILIDKEKSEIRRVGGTLDG